MRDCTYPDYLPHSAVQTISMFSNEEPCSGELNIEIKRRGNNIYECYECDTCREELTVFEVKEMINKGDYEAALEAADHFNL